MRSIKSVWLCGVLLTLSGCGVSPRAHINKRSGSTNSAIIAAKDSAISANALPQIDVSCANTYASPIREILTTKCAQCHVGTAPPGQVDLSSFEGARANAERSLARVLDPASPMPPKGSEQLTDIQKSLVSSWVDCGTPPGASDGSADKLADTPTTPTSAYRLALLTGPQAFNLISSVTGLPANAIRDAGYSPDALDQSLRAHPYAVQSIIRSGPDLNTVRATLSYGAFMTVNIMSELDRAPSARRYFVGFNDQASQEFPRTAFERIYAAMYSRMPLPDELELLAKYYKDNWNATASIQANNRALLQEIVSAISMATEVHTL